MKNTQKGFIGVITGIIIAVVLAGGVYAYLENKNENSSTTEIQQAVNDNGKCGLTISSPLSNEKFEWPLVIKGKVAPQQSQVDNDCSWQTFEGVSGTAQLYFNENNTGWKSVGDSVVFGPDLSVTFNYTEIGLPMNTPMKVVFTEENPTAIRPALVFELPLVLK